MDGPTNTAGAAGNCPNCCSSELRHFYELTSVPVHSVLLLDSRAEALNYPRGDIRLALCERCGFITNTAFDPSLHEYSSRYEETQGFSSTFNAFHQSLAERLIARYQLHGKRILEIGCGKGEFLTLLCEIGGNSGVGFDPAYISDRNTSPARDRITFIKDFYSERYADYQGDFVCCKMTLEHIPDTAAFMATVRRAIGDQPETVVFFQVPDMQRVLRDLAFWDIYYEHCSYFCRQSLDYLFRTSGFEVLDTWTDYDDQYLMIEARPVVGSGIPQVSNEELCELERAVDRFVTRQRQKREEWAQQLQSWRQLGQRVVLWGSGSKGVAFLTTLGIGDEIEYTVDINPYKHGMFMAGTGQQIVAPAFLTEYQPDIVIVMNPIYLQEIQRDLAGMGLAPKLLSV